MKLIYCIFIIFLCITPSLIAIDYFNASSAIIDVNIEGGLILKPSGNNPKISKLMAEIFLLPDDERRQRILDIKPYSNIKSNFTYSDNSINFVWDDIQPGEVIIGTDYRIESRNLLYQISEKKVFPKDIAMTDYTQPTEFIDITPEIKDLANEITKGSTDYYTVIHELANWVSENIAYNLSSLTADVVQKSSWVLDNRQGVCDELTNLFISFCRSLGIPARFVSGMSYSNVIDGFGPHGWAEVYYPGYGWIPVDVNYKQIGWLDATHVKLMHSLDSGEPSMNFNWFAHDISAESKEINLKSELILIDDIITPHETIKVNPLMNNVGPNSYVTIEVEINNPTEYYLPLSLFVTNSPGNIEKTSKQIFLEPHSSFKSYFIINIVEELEPGFIYLAPFEIKTNNGAKHSSDIVFKSDGKVYSKSEAEALILEDEDKKEFIKEMDVNCRLDKNIYYLNETINSYCNISNLGNTPSQIELCNEIECKTFNLLIGETKTTNFNIDVRDTFRNLIKFEYSFNGEKHTEQIPFKIVHPANFTLDVYPSKLPYDSNELKIYVETKAPIKDVIINIDYLGELTFKELKESREFLIPIPAKKIYDSLSFNVIYIDEAGQIHELNFVKKIEITEIPVFINLYRKTRSFILSLFL